MYSIVIPLILTECCCCCCSVTKSCPTLCNCMNRSRLGFPVLHYLLEFAQTHVHWVSDAIQPSHPLPPPSFLPSVFPSIRVFPNESALPVEFFPRHGPSTCGYPATSLWSGTKRACSRLNREVSALKGSCLHWQPKASCLHWHQFSSAGSLAVQNIAFCLPVTNPRLGKPANFSSAQRAELHGLQWGLAPSLHKRSPFQVCPSFHFFRQYMLTILFLKTNKQKKKKPGTSLVVQWLRLHAPNAGDLGLIPGQGTRSHMLELRVCMPPRRLKIPCVTTKS